MGQDFVARKAAKKQRKRQARDAETGRKKRRHKEDGFEIAGGALHCLWPNATNQKCTDARQLHERFWPLTLAINVQKVYALQSASLSHRSLSTLLQAKWLLRTTASAYNMSCACFIHGT